MLLTTSIEKFRDMKRILLLLVVIVAAVIVLPAQRPISLEAIWKEYQFFPRYIPGFNFRLDGKHYTQLKQNKIEEYDLTTGKWTKTILDIGKLEGQADFGGEIDEYSFGPKEDFVLLKVGTEAIYRHSTRAWFYLYDFRTKRLEKIFDEGKIRYATLSPDQEKVAFVYKNNMYIKVLKSGEITQITKDGEMNKIINGAVDWVYEEEFSFSVGFAWAPDGKHLAYYRFDESEVPEFTMMRYNNDMYPEYETFKYPKVGEKNAKVTVHIYDVVDKSTLQVATQMPKEHYIPRIKWTQDNSQLCVFRMNRHQNHLELLLADAETGKTKTLLEEKSKYYVDIHDHLTFLENGKQFIWTSEKDGYNHIYLYNMKGKEVAQLTNGKWDVTKFYGVDEKKEVVYYQAAEESPMERQVYTVNLEGKKKQKITKNAGWNDAKFSSTFDYYTLTYSTVNTPPTYTVFNAEGRKIRMIEDNHALEKAQDVYSVSEVEFFDFTTKDDVELNGWMIKPPSFNPKQKYPVFMYLYGGPGSQEVTDAWMGQNYWWFQMLAQQGFIVACVDNRGTGARGEEFKKMTYLQLGKYETEDQIEAAKYLGRLSYTDQNRIGIFGWSYGGYMSSLCLLKGNDVFKAAIAVAPVTNWKWYDSIYTERFMRTRDENKEGYEDNSPINFVDRLEGDYLLVHGVADDNVHFQHTAEMTRALIEANKQFDTYMYPNKNHGIYGGLTRLHLYTKMTNFINESLNSRPKKVKNKVRLQAPSVITDKSPKKY